MRIAVLDLCGHPMPLMKELPSNGENIIGWLSPHFLEAEFSAYSIEQDRKPLPDIEEFDGLILSGSEHGVYDDIPWIPPLRALLIATKNARKPIFGICFGHQLMADTFGGKAEKSKKGTIIGARNFNFKDESADAHVWHKDHVTEVPRNARITASSNYCMVGGLAYDFPAESVQFHPEISEKNLRMIFERLAGTVLTTREIEKALDSFSKSDVKIDLMARETVEFFRKKSKSAQF